MNVTPLNTKRASNILALKFVGLPPYPYVGNEFEFEIQLVDCTNNGSIKNLEGLISVDLKLYYSEKPLRPCPEHLLKIISPTTKTISITKTGSVMIKAIITDLSVNHENKKFILQASTDNPSIAPAISDPLMVVRYRLMIPKNNVTEKWYKDRGGRHKAITTKVYLMDSNGDLVTDRKVPLKVTLLYEGGRVVVNQDILSICPDDLQFIDESGSATFRFRIEEVSQRHQRQSFVFQIAPDSIQFPYNSDISPDISDPVCVLSKINMNRQRKRMREAGIEPPAGGPALDYSSSYNADDDDEDDEPAAPKLVRGEYSQGSNSTGSYMSRIPSAQLEATPSETRRQIDIVYNWAQKVYNGLDSIQWVKIGEDEKGRPLHRINNPQAFITKIREEFESSVHSCLNSLSRNDPSMPPPVIRPEFEKRVSISEPGKSWKPQGILKTHSTNDLVPTHVPDYQLTSRTSTNTFFRSLGELLDDPENEAVEADGSDKIVVCVPCSLSGVLMGLPIFNSHRELLGFVKEGKNIDGQTVTEEIPFQKQKYSKETSDNASKFLESTLNSQGKLVLTFSDASKVSVFDEAMILSYDAKHPIVDLCYYKNN